MGFNKLFFTVLLAPVTALQCKSTNPTLAVPQSPAPSDAAKEKTLANRLTIKADNAKGYWPFKYTQYTISLDGGLEFGGSEFHARYSKFLKLKNNLPTDEKARFPEKAEEKWQLRWFNNRNAGLVERRRNALEKWLNAVVELDPLLTNKFLKKLLPIDQKKERFHLQQAAHKGCAEAQFKMGELCKVENQIEEAKTWYKRAAEQEHNEARSALVNLEIEENKARAEEQYQLGMECFDAKDYNQARECFEKAVSHGHPEAGLALVNLKIEEDKAKVEARSALLNSMVNLKKIRQTEEEEACLQEAEQQYQLGMNFLNGQGDKFDLYQQARKCFEEAALQGHEGAKDKLVEVYRNLGDLHLDCWRPERANPCYDKSKKILRAKDAQSPWYDTFKKTTPVVKKPVAKKGGFQSFDRTAGVPERCPRGDRPFVLVGAKETSSDEETSSNQETSSHGKSWPRWMPNFWSRTARTNQRA